MQPQRLALARAQRHALRHRLSSSKSTCRLSRCKHSRRRMIASPTLHDRLDIQFEVDRILSRPLERSPWLPRRIVHELGASKSSFTPHEMIMSSVQTFFRWAGCPAIHADVNAWLGWASRRPQVPTHGVGASCAEMDETGRGCLANLRMRWCRDERAPAEIHSGGRSAQAHPSYALLRLEAPVAIVASRARRSRRYQPGSRVGGARDEQQLHEVSALVEEEVGGQVLVLVAREKSLHHHLAWKPERHEPL